MYSLHKLSVSILFVFFSLAGYGGNPYRPVAATYLGMGSLCSVGNGLWASFSNPALNTKNSNCLAGINYENRFGLEELSTRTIAASIPAGRSSAGILFSHFGYTDLRRESIILSSSATLGSHLSGGVTVDYFSERVSGDYEDIQFLSFSAGMIVALTEKTSLGIVVFNPVPNSLRSNSLPSSVIFGTGIRLSDVAFFGAEAGLSSGEKLVLRTGFEYEAAKNFRIRGGFSTENGSFTFGIGYGIRKIAFDLGFATHERLGVTSSLSITYKFK